MSSVPEERKSSNLLFWIGWVVSILPVLLLTMSATMKFLKPPEVIEGFKKLGYAENLAFGLGVTEVICTVLYLIPRTSVLGAILLTGYLGGAIATHVRIGDPYLFVVVLGIMIWGGLYLREARLRTLIPIRCK